MYECANMSVRECGIAVVRKHVNVGEWTSETLSSHPTLWMLVSELGDGYCGGLGK